MKTEERHTPETDDEVWFTGNQSVVYARHARKLERQRDEALEMAGRLANIAKFIGFTGCDQVAVYRNAQAAIADYESFAARVKK